MRENSENQIALLVRDDRTGQHLVNVEALKALGIDPAEAHDRGYLHADQGRSEADSVRSLHPDRRNNRSGRHLSLHVGHFAKIARRHAPFLPSSRRIASSAHECKLNDTA